MKAFSRITATVAMILCAALALAQQGLVDAKQQGLVGERPDGLVALVADGASQAIRELVDEVNAERMEEYRQIASDTDAPLEAVQARAGRQIIERLTAGQYFMDAGGRWRQK
jgi:uncharacterized protein YdbL (DUF1318 family)